MSRRSLSEDDYDDEEYEEYNDKHKGVRHYRKEKEDVKKKRWDRESQRDSNHDYDERR